MIASLVPNKWWIGKDQNSIYGMGTKYPMTMYTLSIFSEHSDVFWTLHNTNKSNMLYSEYISTIFKLKDVFDFAVVTRAYTAFK